MKYLRFHYHMDIGFDTCIKNHHFTLRCIPKSDSHQEILNLKFDVYPKKNISESNDSFENICLIGYEPNEHKKFYIDVTGQAKTGIKKANANENKYKVGFYQYHTEITKPDKTLKAYFSAFQFEKSMSNFDKAYMMMQKLYSDFTYEKNVTNINTTAEQAMAQGKGVCQDYAHILISLCQMAKIPARYVVGLLVGEGYSHAWVEIFDLQSHDAGHWVGIDPTNNLVVDDAHIKMSCGKDYKDCVINQGVFIGGGNQKQNVSVIVYEYASEK